MMPNPKIPQFVNSPMILLPLKLDCEGCEHQTWLLDNGMLWHPEILYKKQLVAAWLADKPVKSLWIVCVLDWNADLLQYASWKTKFATRCRATWLYQRKSVGELWLTCKHESKPCKERISLVTWAIALYFALFEDLNIVTCFFVFHAMGIVPCFIKYPKSDLLVGEHDA